MKPLVGDGTWGWQAILDGGDIVCRGVLASHFGGDDDPMDSGLTASGVPTRGNPQLLGCALPLRDMGEPNTDGSPLPKMPWFMGVRVWCPETNRSLVVPLIDLGPAKWTGHAIDLTKEAFRRLGVPLARGVIRVNYRIWDGGFYIPGLEEE